MGSDSMALLGFNVLIPCLASDLWAWPSHMAIAVTFSEGRKSRGCKVFKKEKEKAGIGWGWEKTKSSLSTGRWDPSPPTVRKSSPAPALLLPHLLAV